MSRRTPMLFPLAFVLACTRITDHVATGTIEATQTDLGSDVSARLAELRVREGATVNPGDTLAILTAVTLPADRARQEAAVADAEAQLADLRAGSRSQEVARARADVDRAASEHDLAESSRRRVDALVKAGALPQQSADEVRAASAQAAARLAAARETLRLLQAGARTGALDAAAARVAQARAGLAATAARQADLVIVAPLRGQVRGTWFEPGEVVPAGRPVLTIADDRHPWVRVYVGQADFARIHAGTGATVTLDAGGAEIPAHVVAMSDRAEFTPRIALTESERADLTFWVKLELSDSTGRAKAGLPATVRFAFDSTP